MDPNPIQLIFLVRKRKHLKTGMFTGEKHNMKIKAKIGLMLLKPRETKDCQQTRGQESHGIDPFSERAKGNSPTSTRLSGWDLSLQSCEKRIVCFTSHPVWRTFTGALPGWHTIFYRRFHSFTSGLFSVPAFHISPIYHVFRLALAATISHTYFLITDSSEE